MCAFRNSVSAEGNGCRSVGTPTRKSAVRSCPCAGFLRLGGYGCWVRASTSAVSFLISSRGGIHASAGRVGSFQFYSLAVIGDGYYVAIAVEAFPSTVAVQASYLLSDSRFAPF